MIRRFLISGLCGGLALCLLAAPRGNAAGPKSLPVSPVRLLEKADALPLALDDTFEFRKQKLFLNDRKLEKPTGDKMIVFERMRINHGAVSREERQLREGHYFDFWWRSARPATVTVRLEYRQANLANFVQARERDFTVGKGTHEASFQIIGDDYHDDGTVTAWRAVVIENGKIVALTQSAMWH